MNNSLHNKEKSPNTYLSGHSSGVRCGFVSDHCPQKTSRTYTEATLPNHWLATKTGWPGYSLLKRSTTNLPIFKLKDSCVRRRYSDFEWLKNELERDSKIVVPPLPGKALKRQLPFRADEGIFDDSFIEERRVGLEQFINRIAGHPLAQNERCLHMFLQDESIDRNYIPGKVRQ
ncbi:sorting nexin-12-like isoform X1 [Conger conger]|uniref:sorting nexin-12-like isoform X1 n=1 Tax=Conger conger TaxID=82655 RepID=UPI002A5A80D1|nr:sorting nexin-12-like isoform X1 [Conger conger]